ncbi:bifunctional phosphatase PAP2/diacylglycerol kinase family protein [Nocardia flavorosea]|uniref:bifunctional phosphatase PAP2/diacylglycerol kinase family protein n=1 Tax=Nocardia flavorosea TaxID=53429 RepID=UPI002458DC83|nr:bifunctional phosphatase PAP2/diacylglycerol kinase family protein [Nocardia flavorosea]
MNRWTGRRFRRIGRIDRAVGDTVAALPASKADMGLLRLTSGADHGVLWMALAGVLASRSGSPRRAAVRGIASVAGASFVTNVVLKSVFARRRPAAELMPAHRRLVPAPTSSSFPSGHSASAAAFATAVAMESPRTALFVAPVAAAVAYSRVHTGVHWGSDVLVGAAVGSGIALATRRWWPVRESDEARAGIVPEVPVLADGKGLIVMVNPVSGDANYDPTDDIAAALPAATVVRTRPDVDCAVQLAQVVDAQQEPVQAVGVAGGDGTVAAVAAFALRKDLPLVVIPTGTLNHFARDLGVYDLREVIDATGVGEAVAVDIAAVEYGDENGTRTRHLINTFSLGSYPDLVRLREKWQKRWGKWPAFAAALVVTLRRAEPIEIFLDGRWQRVWFLFVGNGPYHPHGAVPAFRDRLDSGLLDVRWLRADLRWSRTRAVVALVSAAIGHSRVYGERQLPELHVQLPEPEALAADGEVIGSATHLRFSVAGQLAVYRRDESNPLWVNRSRPHHRRAPWLPEVFRIPVGGRIALAMRGFGGSG